MTKYQTQRFLLLAGATVLYVVGIGAAVVASLVYFQPVTPAKLQNCISIRYYNQPVVDQACLQKTVGTLLEKKSTADLLAYIVATSSPQLVVNNCHAVAHVIGEVTYQKSSSLEDTLAQCNQDCSDGCTHGAIGAAVAKELGEEYDDENIAHAKSEGIKKIGIKYCNLFSLCHAIGHVLYVSFKDFPDALQGCSDISTGVNREGCYEGVFMESSSANDSLGSLLQGTTSVAVSTTNDYRYPCNSVPVSAQKACFLYLPLFQNTLFNQSGVSPSEKSSIAIQTCERFPPQARAYCFEGLGYRVFLSRSKTTFQAAEYCDSMPTKIDRAACSVGISTGLLDQKLYQVAIQYCGYLSGAYGQSVCYQGVFQTLSYHKISSDTLCTSISNPTECTGQHILYTKIETKLSDSYFDLYDFLNSVFFSTR